MYFLVFLVWCCEFSKYFSNTIVSIVFISFMFRWSIVLKGCVDKLTGVDNKGSETCTGKSVL
jgi:hypothetical protein